MKTLIEMFPGATQMGKQYEAEGGIGVYSGEYIQKVLKEWADEWTIHFIDRFNLSEKDLPTDIAIYPYSKKPREGADERYTYGKEENSSGGILSWLITAGYTKGEYKTKLPGAGIIAFIRYNLGINLKEKKDDKTNIKSN